MFDALLCLKPNENRILPSLTRFDEAGDSVTRVMPRAGSIVRAARRVTRARASIWPRQLPLPTACYVTLLKTNLDLPTGPSTPSRNCALTSV